MENQIEYAYIIKLVSVFTVIGGMIWGTFAVKNHRDRIRKMDIDRKERIKALKKLQQWSK